MTSSFWEERVDSVQMLCSWVEGTLAPEIWVSVGFLEPSPLATERLAVQCLSCRHASECVCWKETLGSQEDGVTQEEPGRPDGGVEVRPVAVMSSPASALPARCLQSLGEAIKKQSVSGLSDTPAIRGALYPAHLWWHLRGDDI